MAKEPKQLFFSIDESNELFLWKLKNMPPGMASKTNSTNSKSLAKNKKKLRMNFKKKKMNLTMPRAEPKHILELHLNKRDSLVRIVVRVQKRLPDSTLLLSLTHWVNF
jgi:hypothetical protein